jgi:RimJ/RimL family protein N-acetyltransferase
MSRTTKGPVAFPPLATNRLLLRPFRFEDAFAMHEIYRDPTVMRYIPSGPAESIDRTRRVIDYYITHQSGHGYSVWAMIERQSGSGRGRGRGRGRIIGHAGLLSSAGKSPVVEVVFCLGPGSWGRGYATEAASASLRFGFENLGLDRIIGLTHPANLASHRVLEKIGMVPDGTLDRDDREHLRFAAERP